MYFKKICFLIIYCVAVTSSAFAFSPDSGKTFPATGTIQVAFTPWDDAETLVVDAVHQAQKQILVHAFSFTSKRIAQALIQAKKKGIDVQLLADQQQTDVLEQSVVPLIAASGVPVSLEINYQSAHNKVMIIDVDTTNAMVITGSYNWTYAAQYKNAENLLIFRNNPELARAYATNWKHHRSQAIPYKKNSSSDFVPPRHQGTK